MTGIAPVNPDRRRLLRAGAGVLFARWTDILAKMLAFQTELFYFHADLKIEEKVKRVFF